MNSTNSKNTSSNVVNMSVGEWLYDIPEGGDTNVTWNSSNPDVATVNPISGYVYAKSKGVATISASAIDNSNVTNTYTVSVADSDDIKSVTIVPSFLCLGIGEEASIYAHISPLELSNVYVSWSGWNSNVVYFNSKDGKVQAKTVGKTQITATAGEKKGYCNIIVSQTKTTPVEVQPSDQTHGHHPATGTTAADPIDLQSGAHLLKHTLFNLFGGQGLSLVAHHNSTKLCEGALGIGWYHNYEKKLTVSEDYNILVYDTPASYLKFEATDDSSVFNCVTPGKSGYVLTVDTCSTSYHYCLNYNFEHFEYYNSNGQLVKIVDHHGFATTIDHTDNYVTITDTVTGKKMYLEMSSCGKLSRVYDDHSRYALLTYEDDYLVSIRDVNGNTLSFTYNPCGNIVSGTDSNNTQYFQNFYDAYGRVIAQKDAIDSPPTRITYNDEDNTRTVTNRNGHTSTRKFNDDRLLIEMDDENCNSTSYDYDGNFNIIEEKDGNGNSLTKEYNSFNKPTKITDKNGKITTVTYDTKGNVTKITYPTVNNVTPQETFTYNSRNQLLSHTDLRGTVTLYTYDINGLPLTKKVGSRNAIQYVYENGLLKSVTDAKGNTVRYGYNALGQMISMTDANNKTTSYEYDLSGHLLKTTDANGKTIVNTYDCNYQKTSVTDANGNTTFFAYNGNMKNTAVTLPDGNSIHYAFDSEDRLTKVTDQANNESLTQYDAGGRVISKQAPDGGTITYTYDAAGRVLKETNPKGAETVKTYDKNGNVLTVTDDNGNTTQYQYDALNRLTRKVNPLAGATVYTYSPAGDLLTETDALGNQKQYTYDEYGNKLTFTDARGNTTRYTYDANNNLLTVTDALGNVTTHTYNSLNQLTSVKDAKNNTVTYGYDALGRRTTVTDAKNNTFTTFYDANGNVIKTTDAKGNTVSETTYNSLNLPASITDATGKTLTYTYNAIGKIASVTDVLNNRQEFQYNARGQNTQTKDALNNLSTAVYDTLGNLTCMSGPMGGTTQYTYDKLGRLTSESTTCGGTVTYGYNEVNLRTTLTNARGQNRRFTYDAIGRIIGCISPEDTFSFTYDANGNVLTAADKNGTVRRTYDALNRVLTYTDTYGKIIRYQYDTVGNLTKITYPDNTAVTYAYDANHNLVRVTDWANRVTTYTYDVNNRVVGVTKPDGSVTTTIYDNKQRVTSTVERTANGAVITGFEYTYDDLSRIVEEKVLAISQKMCYTYDDLNRVTKRTVKNLSNVVLSEESYHYDAAGNITSAPDSSFQYDTNNRLTVFNGGSLSYDADGNTLTAPLDGITNYFAYDSANRLVTACCHTYTYNAEDVRIRNRCNDTDTTYTYDTNGKLSRLLTKITNDITTKYVYGHGLIGEEKCGDFKTYHFDYRGSTVAITDQNGNITDTFAYDTYGQLISRTGNSFVIFGYNGRDGVITDHNGLIYMRARYYAPELRRFLNADILKGQISDSTSLNRYSYVNGNPISFVDPFGLSRDIREDEDETQWDENDIKHTWQELGFDYSGSLQDSQRKNAGLPPIQYEQWLKNGYGYSDDNYYFDAILGNYDAIYVADYDYFETKGLPVVAHAYVCLKSGKGNWIITEFSGSSSKNAVVNVYTYNGKENIKKLIAYLDAPVKSLSYLKKDTKIVSIGPISIPITAYSYEEIHIGGVQWIPLKGDFTESFDMIDREKHGNYGGYSPTSNNCLHYARAILKAGTVYDSNVEKYIENSFTIIPDIFYDGLYSVTR